LLAAQSGRGLSVERGRSARLSLDLTPTPVPIAQLYEAVMVYAVMGVITQQGTNPVLVPATLWRS